MGPVRVVVLCLLVAACDRCGAAQREREQWVGKLESARETARVEAANALAPKASRDEVLLIARVVGTSGPETREALVRALAQTPLDHATDPLGEIALSDSSDTVRASAVRALLDRTDEKAKAWLPRAFAVAGPKGRAVFASSPPEALASFVEAGEQQRLSELLRRVDQVGAVAPDVMLRAASLRELGLFDRPEALERLKTFLADPEVTVAGAAAMGLANTGDVAHVPLLEEAIAKSPAEAPERAVVLAFALAQLAADRAGPLRDRIGDVDDGALDRVALVLRDAKVTFAAPLDAVACGRLVETENLDAVEPLAALLPACLPPKTRPARAAGHAPRLRWATVAGTCDRELVTLAKEIVYGEPDARRSIEAARYVGRCGEMSDVPALLEAAVAEIEAAAGVVAAREQLRTLWAERAAAEEAEIKRSMESLLGRDEAAKLDALPSPVRTKLQALLGGRARTSDLLPLELRPFGHDLVATLLVETVRLGGDVRPAIDRLLASKTAEVRGLLLACAPTLAAAAGKVPPDVAKALTAAFERLRDDPSSTVRRMWVEAMGLAGTLPPEQLLSTAKGLDAADRPGVAAWLVALPTAHRPAVGALLDAWAADGSVPRAELAPALARVGSPGAFTTLSNWVRSVDHSGAQAAVEGFDSLGDPSRAAAIEALLVGAALHPETAVRAAAVSMLAKGCRGKAVVGALAAEADRRVRAARQAWSASCGGAPGNAP